VCVHAGGRACVVEIEMGRLQRNKTYVATNNTGNIEEVRNTIQARNKLYV